MPAIGFVLIFLSIMSKNLHDLCVSISIVLQMSHSSELVSYKRLMFSAIEIGVSETEKPKWLSSWK